MRGTGAQAGSSRHHAGCLVPIGAVGCPDAEGPFVPRGMQWSAKGVEFRKGQCSREGAGRSPNGHLEQGCREKPLSGGTGQASGLAAHAWVPGSLDTVPERLRP